ncbi:cuticle protein 16.5-like [Contarinia nasturtii]|uniref:cuticle protein 16.5-like n=1 Tax=Contarinia nasturtii TaxID=265458 RepID=UPI0012D3C584|nr:cuticle protein 16.5-like [Contarinia nasturtii]
MASTSIIVVVLAMFFSATFGAIVPVATSYNAHAINHAVATPFAAPVVAAAAPVVAAAPAPLVAAAAPSPYFAARASYVPSPYATAYSYPYTYPYLF